MECRYLHAAFDAGNPDVYCRREGSGGRLSAGQERVRDRLQLAKRRKPWSPIRLLNRFPLTFGQINPTLGLLFNLVAVAGILFILSMTLILAFQSLFLRDIIRRAEREGRKVEAMRDKIQVKLEKKNHAR